MKRLITLGTFFALIAFVITFICGLYFKACISLMSFMALSWVGYKYVK